MSYSEIKFKIADENPSGANDNDSLTVYRMVAEDPYDGTAFKTGATSFNVTNVPAGTGVIEWQDPSATEGVPYFYRFVFGRSSTNSTSAPSQLIGPLMLQGANSFGYPNNIPSHESGVPNYVDVEPLIHWDSTYEEAARGLNYVYSSTSGGTYQNQADTHNNISLRDSGTGLTKIQTWIDTTGTDRGIPIMGRDIFHTNQGNLGSGIQGAHGDLGGPYSLDGVTVITVSAGGYQTPSRTYGTSDVVGKQFALRWMRNGGSQMETWDSFLARKVDASLPATYKIPAWQVRDEELIQAGTIQRSAQRTGMIWNSDPNDQRNAGAIAWAPTNNHSGVWGHFYPVSGSMYPRVYAAAEKTPTNHKGGYIDANSLNLGVYRQDDLGEREWWWNGELIGYTSALDTSTHYGLAINPTTAQNLMAQHPNWTHVQDNLNANPGVNQTYYLKAGVGDLNALQSSTNLHLAFGWTEVLVFPKKLTGEMLLRAIAYVNQKWGTHMAPQAGHIGA